jgi:hypothetical protein
VALPADAAEAYAAETEGWIVGRVIEGTRTARIVEGCQVIDV